MIGNISHIQRFSVGDGPGIRSTVFFKGCPLHCLWCHNPETIPSRGVLLFYKSLCTGCGKCADVCKNNVHTVQNGDHAVRFEKCIHCGECVRACPQNALEINGKEMSVDDILSVVLQDADFYAASEGGVTLSGGEPLYQPEFCVELARALSENSVRVLIDTALQADESVVRAIMQYADEFYVDIKANSEEDYRKLVGGSLEKVLKNIKLLIDNGKSVTVRIPVIPGHNNSLEYMKKTAEKLRDTGVLNIDLLPFHSLCVSKYNSMGRRYAYEGVESLSKRDIEPLLKAFDGFNAKTAN